MIFVSVCGFSSIRDIYESGLKELCIPEIFLNFELQLLNNSTLLKPKDISCVSTTDTTGSGLEVAFVPKVETFSVNPPSHTHREGVSVLRVSHQTLRNCAKAGTLKVLWLAVDTKMKAGGQGAIAKADCKDWNKLVHHGFARNGDTHIHLNRLDLGDTVFLFEEYWLKVDPKMIAAWIIQAFFLRIIQIGGRFSGKSRLKHLRLVSNLDCGGMCNELLGAAFNRTKSWASKMRKRLVEAALCAYNRRFTWASNAEAAIADLIGEGHRYIEVEKAGKFLLEHVSECLILGGGVEFRSPWSGKPKSGLEVYATKKGRAA